MKLRHIEFIILWKKIFGKLEDREKEALTQWLDSDTKNRELMERFETFHRNPTKISIEQQDQAWQKLKPLINASSPCIHDNKRLGVLRFIYRTAAVFVFVVTAGLLWNYYNSLSRQNDTIAIVAGRAKATLITGNGKSILLGDSVVELGNYGIQAEASGSGLKYFAGAKVASPGDINTLVIPRGGEFELVLADGTHVWLNSESTIRYPTEFAGAIRRVEVTGEAYFEVVKSKEQPFEVVTPGQTILVLGTSFNVTAYPKSDVLTTLVEGEIAVTLQAGQSIHLNPSYQSIYCPESGTLSTHKLLDTDIYTSWKDGLFIFEDERLESILLRLARWYNVDIEYANSSQKDARFTAHIDKYQSITEVLKLIQTTGAVEFEVVEKNIIVK